MSKLRTVTVAALAISLGVNAWQFTQQTNLKQQTQDLQSSLGLSSQAKNRDLLSRSKPKGKPAAEQPLAQNTNKNLKDILAIRDPMGRMQALLEHVKSLSSDEIGEALEDLRASAADWDPETRFIAHLLLTRWGQEDPDAAFASLKKVNAKSGGGDAMSIVASLAAADPKGAVAWLRDPDNALQHKPYLGHMLARTIAKEWSRQDPDAVLAWAAGLPKGQRSGAYAGILSDLASTNPKSAAELAMNLDQGDRVKVMDEIARSWANKSPQEALDWAQSLEGRDRHQAMGGAIHAWAKASPSEAAAFVDQLPQEARAGDLIKQVVEPWATQAPAEAATWLAAQPETEQKVDAMGGVLWDWTHNDPESASAWLGAQPASESRDRGVAGLAKAAFETDPAAAVTWASTIGDGELRTKMMDDGLRRWTQTDREAAKAWADQNQVPLPGLERRDGK